MTHPNELADRHWDTVSRLSRTDRAGPGVLRRWAGRWLVRAGSRLAPLDRPVTAARPCG